jgi:hypothetical protein
MIKGNVLQSLPRVPRIVHSHPKSRVSLPGWTPFWTPNALEQILKNSCRIMLNSAGIHGRFSLVNAVRFYFATSSFGGVTECQARKAK